MTQPVAELGVATICHGPCVHYLKDHLTALKRAISLSGHNIPVGIVISQLSTKEQKDYCVKVVAESGLDSKVFLSEETLSISAARTAVAKLTKSNWLFYTDVDTVIDPHCFDNMLGRFPTLPKDIGAISGGIGVWRHSTYGKYDALWEIITLYRRIKPEFESFICNSLGQNWPNELNQINALVWDQLDRRMNLTVKFLQGYNMTIRRDVLEARGFEEQYSGAEDRALAAHITGPLDLKIVCWPDCLVYHDFDFTLVQIQQRKISHALFTNKVRQGFRCYGNVSGPTELTDWLINSDSDHPSCPSQRMFPFNAGQGKEYAAVSNIAYAYGSLRSMIEDELKRPTTYYDHRKVLNNQSLV